ncbi:hypothetical protein H5410_021163 [Solanum commersonii]|uniref:Cyclic nucleotide-binding domain-containing protein n=1 Tax=Solanum commersonii TaxID=4109 RepID=A0A9J5ZB65_SOLCO|nr:hypothetical protein H5410_021163 [Solanum commersonii]
MKTEYFPSKEDVILQNEEPRNMYILITRAMDLISYKNGMDQVVGELIRGLAVCGEVDFVNIHTCRSMSRLGGTKFVLHESEAVFGIAEQREDEKYSAPFL